MKKAIEFWKVIDDEGEFYTLEKADGGQRDFLKRSIPFKLEIEDNVAILCFGGMRSVLKKVSKNLTEEEMSHLADYLR